jgi:hypothetical protein
MDAVVAPWAADHRTEMPLEQEKNERPRESSTVVVDRLSLADAALEVERTMGGCRSPTIAGWFGRTTSEPP